MKSRKCGERTFFIGEKAAFLSFLCNYRVTSNVVGAKIYLDSALINTMPESKTITLTGIKAGNHNVKLTHNDYATQEKTVSIQAGKTATVSFQLTTTNTAPMANAGTDQSGFSGYTYSRESNGTKNIFTEHAIIFTLDGSGSSDPNGDTLTYSWMQTGGPAITLSSSSASTTTFIPVQEGTYSFQLTVNDGVLDDTDNVEVTVEKPAGKIVFSANLDQMRPGYDLYRMNADGSNLIRLTDTQDDKSWPAWSPDGGTIAYNKPGDNWGIYLMNSDGTNQRPLNSPIQAYNPNYSPDGTYMAVTGPGNQIYIINLLLNTMTQITNLSVNYLGPECWLPDNQTVVFSGEYSLGSYNWEIMTVNADGSGYTRITNNTDLDFHVNPTPDGRMLYISEEIRNVSPYGHKNLYILNADGTGNTLIADEDHGYMYPVMTTDGIYIIYSDEDGYIHVMTADGSLDQNLGIWGRELGYTPH